MINRIVKWYHAISKWYRACASRKALVNYLGVPAACDNWDLVQLATDFTLQGDEKAGQLLDEWSRYRNWKRPMTD